MEHIHHIAEVSTRVQEGTRRVHRTFRGTIVDFNAVDKFYTIATECGRHVRARAAEVSVFNIHDLEPPAFLPPRNRDTFEANLAASLAAENEEDLPRNNDEDEVEIAIGIPVVVVYGIAV